MSFFTAHNKCTDGVFSKDKAVTYKGLLLNFEVWTFLFTRGDKPKIIFFAVLRKLIIITFGWKKILSSVTNIKVE